jgi:hypothetical protein
MNDRAFYLGKGKPGDFYGCNPHTRQLFRHVFDLFIKSIKKLHFEVDLMMMHKQLQQRLPDCLENPCCATHSDTYRRTILGVAALRWKFHP